LGVSTKSPGIYRQYFSHIKVKGFLQSTIDDAREHNYAKTMWGRKRYFNYLHDRNDNVRRGDERAACNAPIQGSAADLVKLAMIKLDEELSKYGLKAKLILQVHDELDLKCQITS
jgi:DNA polymerase-1